jgi:23S rRNA (cytosine1962-C5)-methyltransferase
VLEFGEATIDRTWLATKIRAADERRRLMGFGPGTDTTGYRMVFGESDGLPGLVVDRFGDVLVFQISTAGMDALREPLIEVLLDLFSPSAIVERSDLPGRREERLQEVTAVHHGEASARAPFTEWGVPLQADVTGGQKTGFFLDQKELRRLVRGLPAALARDGQGPEVLNLFSYSGATGLAALLGGAARVHNVDGSEQAITYAREHAQLNGVDEDRFTTERADVFHWLSTHQEPAYDLVLLDPPALIKSQRDTEQGRRAYHFLNRAALRVVKDGGVLVTSSCSNHFPEEDLAFELRRAATTLGVTVHALASVRQSADHPLSVYFPEALYLKSLVLQVRRDGTAPVRRMPDTLEGEDMEQVAAPRPARGRSGGRSGGAAGGGRPTRRIVRR